MTKLALAFQDFDEYMRTKLNYGTPGPVHSLFRVELAQVLAERFSI